MKLNRLVTVLAVFLLSIQTVFPKERSNALKADSSEAGLLNLTTLVNDAAKLIQQRGETAFSEFRMEDSRWRTGERYVFVIDTAGRMLVHNDPMLEGRNQLELKDINGKPIIRGILETAEQNKNGGWYHYQWPVPGGLLPRWKSSFVTSVKGPSGNTYIIGCGEYNDRMERTFVIHMVDDAAALIENNGKSAFQTLRDPSARFIAKDAYIFVVDEQGVELVNPGFPSLEGRNVMDVKDTKGKYLVREMFELTGKQHAGWVEYMWPKPGQSVSTLKSTYVRAVSLDGKPVIVGCGVYLADAPVMKTVDKKMTAVELERLVQAAAKEFAAKGSLAFPEFREHGSKWFHDETYFFVWDMNGKRIFHAANPVGEGQDMHAVKDVLGRPWGKMFLDAAASPTGEGWVHYLYPEPGDIFPAWKSSFIKKVVFPDGKEYLIGCGIYQMDIGKTFVEDVVMHAASLIEQKGPASFDVFRDKTGPFLFLDTYVFVDSPDGVELVNAAQPSLEQKNLIDLRDAQGHLIVKKYIDAAMKNGQAWVDYHWYKPGSNDPAIKHTFVKKAVYQGKEFIVGAGYYE